MRLSVAAALALTIDFPCSPRSRAGALNTLKLHTWARGQPQNQQADTFHSAAQIYSSDACGETPSGWSFKVRHWRAERCHWFWCRAVKAVAAGSGCRGYSHVSFTVPLTALLCRCQNEHRSLLCCFNRCQVWLAAPLMAVKGSIKAFTYFCLWSVCNPFSWLSSPCFTGRQINLASSDSVDFRSCEHQLLLVSEMCLHPLVVQSTSSARGGDSWGSARDEASASHRVCRAQTQKGRGGGSGRWVKATQRAL